MAVFEIDGAAFQADPRACEWKFDIVGEDGNGRPILSPFALVAIARTWMTNAQFNQLFSKSPQGGYTAAVSVKIPAPGSGTLTTYTGCYLGQVTGNRNDARYVRDVRIEIRKVAY